MFFVAFDATFSKHEITHSIRASVLVNIAIVATHISELSTRDVCADTVDASLGN